MSNTTASQPSPGRLGAFKVSRVWRGNTVYVFASGELDLATAARLEDACEAADGVTRLVVDLRAVTFIDSAGGRVLVGLFGSWGATVTIMAGAATRRVVDVAGLSGLLPVVYAPDSRPIRSPVTHLAGFVRTSWESADSERVEP